MASSYRWVDLTGCGKQGKGTVESDRKLNFKPLITHLSGNRVRVKGLKWIKKAGHPARARSRGIKAARRAIG